MQPQEDGAAGAMDDAEEDGQPAAVDDAEYEYVAEGAAREEGEAQALGPATEEQAAELRGGELPDAAGASAVAYICTQMTEPCMGSTAATLSPMTSHCCTRCRQY